MMERGTRLQSRGMYRLILQQECIYGWGTDGGIRGKTQSKRHKQPFWTAIRGIPAVLKPSICWILRNCCSFDINKL
jgi:hypothetical protein